MFTTVTETIDGIAQQPTIFSDAKKAEDNFNARVEECQAEITYTDEFCKVAKIDRYVAITLHYQVPRN